MYQLIMVIMAISLASAVTMATLNYTPSWIAVASKTETVASKGFLRLEASYKVFAKYHEGASPPITGAADGGLAATFLNYLGFMPQVPAGYYWKYGIHPNDGSSLSNLNYFCLTSDASGAPEGIVRGLHRLSQAQQPSLNPSQTSIGTNCGSSTSLPLPADYPAQRSITYYVKYVAGVD